MSEQDLLRLITSELEARSEQLQELATGISTRLKAFEDWLCGLPGKTECTYFAPKPNIGDKDTLGLMFAKKEGHGWKLWYGVKKSGLPVRNDAWDYLENASLPIKLAAIELIPPFVEKLNGAQHQLVSQLTAATATLSSYSVVFKPIAKEGK